MSGDACLTFVLVCLITSLGQEFQFMHLKSLMQEPCERRPRDFFLTG